MPRGWYEKQMLVPSIGRRVAPEHRVAALKGCHASGLGVSRKPRMGHPKTNKQRIVSYKRIYRKTPLPTFGTFKKKTHKKILIIDGKEYTRKDWKYTLKLEADADADNLRRDKGYSVVVRPAPFSGYYLYVRKPKKKQLPTRGSGYITLRDSDRDRVPDIYDCDPFDPSKQDLKELKEKWRKAKETVKGFREEGKMGREIHLGDVRFKKMEKLKEKTERAKDKSEWLRIRVEGIEKLVRKKEELAEEKERLEKLKERYKVAKGKTKSDIAKKLGKGLIRFGRETSEYIKEEKWKEGTTRKRPSKGVKSGRPKLKKPRKKKYAKRKYYYRKVKGKRVRCKMPK